MSVSLARDVAPRVWTMPSTVWRFERRTLFDKIRKQFLQRAWIHYGAGKNMRANGSTLFDDSDFNLAQRFALTLAALHRVIVSLY